jgi:1-acylglycerone phosphate reductase
MLSDNLRIELSPFKVKVINVVTGGIKTKFFDNLPVQKLPPNSYYEAARNEIEAVFNGSFIEGSAWDVDRYAKVVVENALKSSPKAHLWAGSSAWTVWAADTFGWSTIWVYHSLLFFVCF